jgi:nucleotide-binding universal stress UspA family protein
MPIVVSAITTVGPAAAPPNRDISLCRVGLNRRMEPAFLHLAERRDTMADQLDIERLTARETASRRDVNSGIKTILLHVQNDESLDGRLQAALSLARACEAHLSCLHITPIEAYVAFDSFGGVFVMNDVIKALDEEEARLRSRVEEELRNEDVSWDYIQVTGNVAGQLVSHAALADLIVTGREPHRSEFAGPAVGLLGDLICHSRAPLFIPSDDARPVDPTGVVLIAWDGSYEAANAVRSSVGLLKLASSVHVLQVKEEEKDEAFPGTRLLEYLSRHDVHAEYSVIEAGVDVNDQAVISDTLAARAQALRASYLVMGGYNHSRVGEYIFGGVTRTMLSKAPVPLLIAR